MLIKTIYLLCISILSFSICALLERIKFKNVKYKDIIFYSTLITGIILTFLIKNDSIVRYLEFGITMSVAGKFFMRGMVKQVDAINNPPKKD